MVMTSGNIVLVPYGSQEEDAVFVVVGGKKIYSLAHVEHTYLQGHGWGRNAERGLSSSRHYQMREEKEYHILSERF